MALKEPSDATASTCERDTIMNIESTWECKSSMEQQVLEQEKANRL